MVEVAVFTRDGRVVRDYLRYTSKAALIELRNLAKLGIPAQALTLDGKPALLPA
jgi:hypothetical protein